MPRNNIIYLNIHPRLLFLKEDFSKKIVLFIRNLFQEYCRPDAGASINPILGVGNLLHLKSQISPFVTTRNPTGAANLPPGPKTSVIPKRIPKERSLFTSKWSHNLGFKEPQVADPCPISIWPCRKSTQFESNNF